MTDQVSNGDNVGEDFDLRPDPRVLLVLGEIDLDQWRCLGELIDNALDGFLNESRKGATIKNPEVFVDLPTSDIESAMVRVRDNGPGMTPEILQRAVSAGWSGNNPLDNLGLFGMGFNIATARLGSVTEVWTTQAEDTEWHGLEIDFERLRQQRHFRTAHLRRPKADPAQHGTEVSVKRLKSEQRTWLARSSNHGQLRRRLAQIYSAMLRATGTSLSFKLYVNNRPITARNHCVWNEDRSVSLTNIGEVPAVIHLDRKLAERCYCVSCMSWLGPDAGSDEPCPLCSSEGTVTSRDRRVKGWIGIQRYLDKTDFGFDLIRNGRKIELNNKDLFVWRDAEGDEPEYPIDDQRGRGRFVGELHIDHCRVNYAKDHFDRTDPAWEEMVALVRGEGPLRPEKARSLGFQGNESSLYRLFRAFRRSSPQSKVAGAWKRIIVVKDNDRASEMARRFHQGDPEYQDDGKWWELVEEADRELLQGGGKRPDEEPTDETNGDDIVGEILGGSGGTTDPTKGGEEDRGGESTVPAREPIPSLSRTYTHAPSGVSWKIEAFSTDAEDPDLKDKGPWTLEMADTATRTRHFLVDREHDSFRSMTLTLRDALLMELARLTNDYLRETPNPPSFARVVAELRDSYGAEENLDSKQMQPDAVEVLDTIARLFVRNTPEEERRTLFNELDVDEQQGVMRALARRRIKPAAVIEDGSFLRYVSNEYLAKFVAVYPEYCFDGKIWDEPHDSLDYGDPEITNEAKDVTRRRFRSLINDVTWLATREASDLAAAPREELIRAMMSLKMLRPDVESS